MTRKPLLLTLLLAAALSVGGCSTALKSDGFVERSMRYLGGPQVIDTILPLIAPRPTSDFASQAVGYSVETGEPVLLQIPREDAAHAVQVTPGMAVVVTEGGSERSEQVGGARVVTADAWRLRPASPGELQALFASLQCAVLGGRPECPEWSGGSAASLEAMPREVPAPSAGLAAPRAEPACEPVIVTETEVVEVENMECRAYLWQVRTELAALLDFYDKGTPDAVLQPLRGTDAKIKKFLDQ